MKVVMCLLSTSISGIPLTNLNVIEVLSSAFWQELFLSGIHREKALVLGKGCGGW